MKRFDRRVLGIFLAPVVFIAALASGSYSICAYAEEITEQFTISEEEQPLADKPRGVQPEEAKPGEVQPEEVAYEAPEGQEPSFDAPGDMEAEKESSDKVEGTDSLTGSESGEGAGADAEAGSDAKAGDLTKAPSNGEHYYDICFYIKDNAIDGEIPTGVLGQILGTYSAPIRINNAVSDSDLYTSSTAVEGSEDNLLDDGMTAANEVTAMLSLYPDESAIKAVIPEFDPFRHYVVWYVIKDAPTAAPNSDVTIHVDGVIRTRQNPLVPDPEEDPIVEPEKPNQPVKPEVDPEIIDMGKKVEIEIQALLLDENGNDATEIPYDGQEHMVGGFAINVKDKADHNLLEELIYNYKGALLRRTVYAQEGYTSFPVRDRVFSVNITGAYATVQNIGQAIVAFYSGTRKLNGPEDIIIRDENGTIISSYINVVTKPATVTVSKRPLTIEAGTSVLNDNGQTLTNDTYKILKGSLLEGHELHCVFNGSQTGVGHCSNEITAVTIYDANGNDVSGLYDVETKKGLLQLVDPKGNEANSGTDATGQNSEASGVGSSASTAVNSKNRYETVKVVLKDGSVTYVNVPYRVGAANPSEVVPEVLGARRAGTGDNTHNMARLLAIFACAAIMTEVARRRNSR